MFTKSKDSSWNIVFVHWGLFENPNISIHEIVVPTRFEITGNELILRFEAIVSEMKAEILRNLDNTAWSNTHDNDREFIMTLREQIASDIGSTSILKNHISKFINGYKNGTILFIEKLHDNWDLYLSPMSGEARKNDPMTEKMHNRFASFVSTLDTAVSPSLPFNVEVYYNNKAWETEFGYTEEDYKVYDIKVDGRIEKGRFYGYLDACNADQHLVDICNQQLKEGLDVTAGIADWQDKDCGTFSIKFCHLEGSQNRSGLSVDDYNRIKEKLKVSCGICVYRDGVRILPYGEPENDFADEINSTLSPYLGLELPFVFEETAKQKRQILQETIDQNIKEAFEKFRKQICPLLLQMLISSNKMLTNSSELVGNIKYECYENTSLRELLQPGEAYDEKQKNEFLINKIHFGDVLIKYDKHKGNQYMLCLTPPCDAFRPEKTKLNLLFIRGSEIHGTDLNSRRKESSHLSALPVKHKSKMVLRYINWKFYDIVKVNLNDDESYKSLYEWERPYLMAEPYARQIANAFTAYFSRAGVDELFMKSESHLRRIFK